MENLPAYVGITFGLTTGLMVWLFYRAANKSRRLLGVLLMWLLVQGVVGLSGFYTVTDTLPPRFLLLVGPPVLAIAALFCTTRGQAFLDGLRIDILTLLHVVRVPLEMVLYWLFLHGAVPELMTFEGRNWDILSGLSAPIVFYLIFSKRQLGRKALLAWNFICMGLAVAIVVNAVLSAPSPFQQFAFSQPNVAVQYFPFVWLPACVVPLALLSHLAAIRQLLLQKTAVPSTVRAANSQVVSAVN
ncbi:hypothetical protein [Hymenobacter sp. B1770]|uniref:hypothetical protein n=1 Tax=Hymenobacter sp. B1770 TaxID=1718788 RepID=UPI003CF105FD